MEVNWSYQSSQTFVWARRWESFFEKAKPTLRIRIDWLGKLGVEIKLIFILQALPHSDDISIISHTLGIIMLGALEDADEESTLMSWKAR